MRVAIVDNDQAYGQLVEEYLRAYAAERGCDIRVSRYDSGEAFQAEFRSQFDMILLDVDLPGMNGVQAARILREKDPDVAVLFITHMLQYAICGYEVDALAYILKPVTYFAFARHLDRVLARIRRREKQYLLISDRSGSLRLAVEDIYYLESQGHQLVYHTRTGRHTVQGTMAEAEKRLSDHRFFRCNKGYLVSLRHVEGIRNGCALVHGAELIISRSRKTGFLKALSDYIESTARA